PAHGRSARPSRDPHSRLRARHGGGRSRIPGGTSGGAGGRGLAFPAGVVRPGAGSPSRLHALGGPRSVARRSERPRAAALRAFSWRADEREPARDAHVPEPPPRRRPAAAGAAALGSLALFVDPAPARASSAVRR